jgi:hypothetical protein
VYGAGSTLAVWDTVRYSSCVCVVLSLTLALTFDAYLSVTCVHLHFDNAGFLDLCSLSLICSLFVWLHALDYTFSTALFLQIDNPRRRTRHPPRASRRSDDPQADPRRGPRVGRQPGRDPYLDGGRRREDCKLPPPTCC